MAKVASDFQFKFDIDASPATRSIGELVEKLYESEKAAEKAHNRIKLYADGISGAFKAAAGSIAAVAALLKVPFAWSDYVADLNTKVVNINGNLERFSHAANILGSDLAKLGSGGLNPGQYQELAMAFASGADAVEKFGKSAKENLTDFAVGGEQLIRGIGFNPEQASQIQLTMHRTLGLMYQDMEGFGKQLTAVAQTSDLTANQIYGVTNRAMGLAKAYNLNGIAARTFVAETLNVGSAISKLGLDAENTINKMNEIATGSEQGLIQSLLLGFKPGDTGAQLLAFQDQAKNIVQMAAGAGEQFAPFLIRKMADAMGMKEFSVEAIQKLASGATVEEIKGKDTKKDASEIFANNAKQITDAINANQKLYLSETQRLNQVLNKLMPVLRERLAPAAEGLVNWLRTTGPKIIDFLDKALKFLGKFTGQEGPSATTLLAGTAAALFAPTAAKLGIEYMVLKKAAQAAAGKAAGTVGETVSKVASAGSKAGAEFELFGTGTQAPGLGAVTASKLIGPTGAVLGAAQQWYEEKDVAAGREQQAKRFSDGIELLKRADAAKGTDKERQFLQLAANAFGRISGMGIDQDTTKRFAAAGIMGPGPVNKEGSFTPQQGKAMAEGLPADDQELLSFAQERGFELGKDSKGTTLGTTTGGVHKEKGHYEGRAIDLSVHGKSEAERTALVKDAEAAGYRAIYNKPGHYDHIHLEKVVDKLANGKVISTPDPKALYRMHDEGANKLLQQVVELLSQHPVGASIPSSVSNPRPSTVQEKTASIWADVQSGSSTTSRFA